MAASVPSGVLGAGTEESEVDVASFGRHGTDPAAAFLHRLAEKHDISDTTFLVDQFGYRTALSRLESSGQVAYTGPHLIEKWFHIRNASRPLPDPGVDSRWNARRWLTLFVRHYSYLRPHQSFDGRTPAREVN